MYMPDIYDSNQNFFEMFVAAPSNHQLLHGRHTHREPKGPQGMHTMLHLMHPHVHTTNAHMTGTSEGEGVAARV